VRVLYLHQYFMTRAGVGGTRSYEFARQLTARGHRVTIVTAGSGDDWEGRSLTRRRDVEGIDVLEVRAGYSDYVGGTKMGYARRIWEFARFAVAATVAVAREPRPDVVYATSPPLTMALPGFVASRRHRVPLVFEVRDLWPEAPIQMGALSNPLAQRAARLVERAAYGAAAHVIALSPGMREGVIAAGVPETRTSMISNASDLDLFSPDVDGSAVRERLGLGDRLVCSYFGTMGEANDLTYVIDAADRLRERGEEGIAFVLHGDGKRRGALEDMVRSRGLQDTVVLSRPHGDKAAVAELAAASDACMTIYKDVPILYTCSPNKLFDTFAAGRAAIVNTPGWLQELVEENDAGLYARHGEPAHLAEQAVWLRDHRDRVAEMGANARTLAEREFDRRLLAGRVESVLRRAVAGG
jgi:glycosyltransferase involved in cell wall biosynthesis